MLVVNSSISSATTIARREVVDNKLAWVHRKGATRAFPEKHPALRETPYFDTGHPILLPGDPQAGSAVMVAEAGAEKSCFSVNHGAASSPGAQGGNSKLGPKEHRQVFRRSRYSDELS